MPSESRIRQPLGIMTRMITPRGRGGPTALPMQIERTVQSTNGFRLFSVSATQLASLFVRLGGRTVTTNP